MRSAARAPPLGARQEQPGGLFGGPAQAADAAVGLHQEDGGGEAVLAQAAFQTVQIGAHDGDQQGVQHSGAGALVLADFRADLAGQRHGQAGPGRREPVAEALFVGGVGVGVQQADRDAFGPARVQPGEQGGNGGLVQGAFDRAVGADPFGHTEAAIAGDQDGGGIGVQPVEFAAGVAGDLQHVLEPRRGDEGAAGQGAFQHGVGGDGGAVQQQADLVQGEAEPFGGFADAVQ